MVRVQNLALHRIDTAILSGTFQVPVSHNIIWPALIFDFVEKHRVQVVELVTISSLKEFYSVKTGRIFVLVGTDSSPCLLVTVLAMVALKSPAAIILHEGCYFLGF